MGSDDSGSGGGSGAGLLAIRTVFASKTYIGLALAVGTGFFLLFSALDEYLFFSPILVYHVPPDGVANFGLSLSISALLAVVISMNVYMLRSHAGLRGMASWLSGSCVAASAGACGCTSLGFALISTLGGAGIVASSFFTNFQLPLKIASLTILLFAYYSVQKKVISDYVIGERGTS